MSFPWGVLIDSIATSINADAHTKVAYRASNSALGDDDFRAKLLEEGYVCDALDTMNQWYFAIVIKVDRAQNSVKIHYDCWPSKYDEFIDVSSHRLQPFMTRARLNQRPFLTRPHPGHAVHAINLDKLLGPQLAAGENVASPAAAQYQPSAANNLPGSNASYEDFRQLSFDLSNCVATMGETAARAFTHNDAGVPFITSPTSSALSPTSASAANASSSSRMDYSSQLHSFSLKLKKNLASFLGADSAHGIFHSQHVQAYAVSNKMLSFIASNSPNTVLPSAINVSHPISGTLSGEAAITAALTYNALPSPFQFTNQSLSSTSCLSEGSYRNHLFLDAIGKGWEKQLEKIASQIVQDSFLKGGICMEAMKGLPFEYNMSLASASLLTTATAVSNANNAFLNQLPTSLIPKVIPRDSRPICSYLLLIIQRFLAPYSKLPAASLSSASSSSAPQLVKVTAKNPRGVIDEQPLLIALSLSEMSYFNEIKAFLCRIILSQQSDSNDVELLQLKRIAFLAFVQLCFALGKQDCLLELVSIFLQYFRTDLLALQDESVVDDVAKEKRALIETLCSITHVWSKAALASSKRLLGQSREEVSSGLSEARTPVLPSSSPVAASASSPAASAPAAAAAAAAASSNDLPPATVPTAPSASTAPTPLVSLVSTDYPSPASLINLGSFHPPSSNTPLILSSNSASAASPPSTSNLPETARIVIDPTGNWMFALTPDFGLVKIGTGNGGTTGGRIAKQNACFAIHAPFANLAFLPSGVDLREGTGYLNNGALIMRTQLCPQKLLFIDPVTLQYTGQEIQLEGELEKPDNSWSWELNYAPSATSLSSTSNPTYPPPYDPTNLPPLVLSPNFRAEVQSINFIVDAQNHEGDWFPAMVTNFQEEVGVGLTVTVHFDGLPPSLNEKIPFSANRLAPFGTRINTLQRFSKSNQQGDHLIDLAAAIRQVARLTGRQLFQSPNLNTADFQRMLKEGLALDAKDSSEMWYFAEIVKIEGESVTVRYDGWASSYNETIPRTSARLAPFCTQTCLALRLKDPQQDARFALNLDQAIAEVRGRIEAKLSENEALSENAYFLQRFDQEILRSSEWSFGTTVPLHDPAKSTDASSAAAPSVYLLMDKGGMILVNRQRETRKTVWLSLKHSEGVVMTAEQEQQRSEEAQSDSDAVSPQPIAASFSLSGSEPAAPAPLLNGFPSIPPVIPSGGSSAPAAATASSSASAANKTVSSVSSPTMLTQAAAARLRTILDASCPLFVVDRTPLSKEVDLLLLRYQEDGVRLKVDTYSLQKHSLERQTDVTILKLNSTSSSVDLLDTLPTVSIHPVPVTKKDSSSSTASKQLEVSLRDLDNYCRSCGTYVTAPLAGAGGSPGSVASASLIQSHSPGVKQYLKCCRQSCEKTKHQMCLVCQSLYCFAPPHDIHHVCQLVTHELEGTELKDPTHAVVTVSAATAVAASASASTVASNAPTPSNANSSASSSSSANDSPIYLTTRQFGLIALFDPRDDTFLLSSLAPAYSSRDPIRPFDFRVFDLHTGALQAAPTPSSNACTLFLHAPICDYSTYKFGHNPQASIAAVYKLSKNGNIGRSYWTPKSPSNHVLMMPPALSRELPSFEQNSNHLLLNRIISQILACIPVVEQQEHAVRHFELATKVLLTTGQEFCQALEGQVTSSAADLKQRIRLESIRTLFTEALQLVVSYLAHLTSYWPMLRPENSITSNKNTARLQQSKQQLKSFLIDDLLTQMLTSTKTEFLSPLRSLKIEALIAQLCVVGFGFLFSSWLERFSFLRMLYSALQSDPTNPTASLVLNHLSIHYFQQQWHANPAGGSCSMTSQNIFVDLEINSRDLGVIPVDEEKDKAHKSKSSKADAVAADVAPSEESFSASNSISTSLFNSEFRSHLDFFLNYPWEPSSTGAPAIPAPQVLVNYLLIALQFHLFRLIPSADSNLSAGSAVGAQNQGSDGLMRVSIKSLQYCQAKPVSDLLMYINHHLYKRFSNTLLSHRTRDVSLDLHYSLYQLLSFSTFILAQLDLKLVSPPLLIALLPNLFRTSYEIERKYVDKRKVEVVEGKGVTSSGNSPTASSGDIAPTLIRQASTAISTSVTTAVSTISSSYQLRFLNDGSVAPSSTPASISGFSALIKTALMALFKVLYSSLDSNPESAHANLTSLSTTASKSTAKQQVNEEERNVKLQQLTELSHISSTPLSHTEQAFLHKFVNCNVRSGKDLKLAPTAAAVGAVAADSSSSLPEPEVLLSLLFQQCLLEMGGGASTMDIAFAWPMERAAAATFMRYMFVADTSSQTNPAAMLSPNKKETSTPSGSSTASSGAHNMLLLDCCIHFAHSLDIHLLLSKAQSKNVRLLMQSELPSWFRQLIYLVFEKVRTPLLEKMRAQETEKNDAVEQEEEGKRKSEEDDSKSDKPHRIRKKSAQAKELSEEAVVAVSSGPDATTPNRTPSPLETPPLLESSSSTPVNDKVQANTATKNYVKRLLSSATFLLFTDFTATASTNSSLFSTYSSVPSQMSNGPSTPSKPNHDSSSRFTSPSASPVGSTIQSLRSPNSSPLDQLSLDDSHIASQLAMLAPLDPLYRMGAKQPHLSTSGADDLESDEDESEMSPPAPITLFRSLSDRIPSSSPPPVTPASNILSEMSASSGVSFLPVSPLSSSTAAHSLALRRIRRSNLIGSSAWLIGLIQSVGPEDQAAIQSFMVRDVQAYRLGQARVDLLKLVNAQMARSFTGDEDSESAGSTPSVVAPVSPQLLKQPNILLDEFLPMIWTTLATVHAPVAAASASNPSSAAANAGANSAAASVPSSNSSSAAADHRMHLLYPSVSLCQLNEKAYNRSLNRSNRDANALSVEDAHSTFLTFLRGLTAWLDASIQVMDLPEGAQVYLSPVHQHRLRLIFHFLSQEFYLTTRDRSTLLSSGVLASLVRFGFHSKVVSEMNELSRIAWTIFSYLIANVLGAQGPVPGLNLSVMITSAAAGSPTSGTVAPQLMAPSHLGLQNALKPLHEAILSNLSFISSSISSFNPLLPLPPQDMLSLKNRYTPPALDLDNLKVEQLVDARDKQNAWYPARIVKLERKLGGVEAFVQFSGWAESSNEWIPIKSGKLATLFTHVDIEAYNQSGRPNKYRLDLSAEIAYHKSKQAQPISEATKSQAKKIYSELQIGVNEKIHLTINLIRIVCTTSITMASPSSSPSTAAAASGPLEIISSFLKLLTQPSSSRSLPMVLKVELLQFIRKSLPRYSVHDFNAAHSSHAMSSSSEVLNADQVVRCLLKLMGSCLWSCRSEQNNSTSDSKSAIDSIDPLDQEAWLYQNWFDSSLNITDGYRKLHEFCLQFFMDHFLTASQNVQSGNGSGSWSKLLLQVLESHISNLPQTMQHLHSRATETSADATSDSLGLDDESFYTQMACMQLMSGCESFLRNGTPVSVKLNEEQENETMDTADAIVDRIANVSSRTDSATGIRSTDRFDFQTIVHGYVSSFTPSVILPNGFQPIMSVEVLWELDADNLSTPGANQTNISYNNSLFNRQEPTTTLSKEARTTLILSALPNVHPLPSRQIRLGAFVEKNLNDKFKNIIVDFIRNSVVATSAAHTNPSRLVLSMLQYECLRILSAQISNGSWTMTESDLSELLQSLRTGKTAASAFFMHGSSAHFVPRNDVFQMALALQGSKNFQLDQASIAAKMKERFQIPSSLSTVADINTSEANGSSSGDLDDDAEVELPQPDILSMIESINAMGYSSQQARAALIEVGVLDLGAAVELIIMGHRSVNRLVSDERWNQYLDQQGLRATVEKYLKQQQAKKAKSSPTAASSSVDVAASDVSSSSSTSNRRALNAHAEQLFLGPWYGSTERELQSLSIARTPLSRIAASVKSLIGLPVFMKSPVSNVVPQVVLQSGIIVKTVTVDTASLASVSSSNETSSNQSTLLRGLVLVRFSGVLSSTKPTPSCYAWVSISDLFLDPLSPFDVSKQALVLALTCSNEELHRRAAECADNSVFTLATTMLSQCMRRDMRTQFLASSTVSVSTTSSSVVPSLPPVAFTLQELFNALPLFTHPIDSFPNLCKLGSKNRMKLIEQVAAYLLQPVGDNIPSEDDEHAWNKAKTSTVSNANFERFLNQMEDVLRAVPPLVVNVDVKFPNDRYEPLSLAPLPDSNDSSSASSDSRYQQSDLVGVIVRTDSWNNAQNGSNILSFYSDPLHLHLLKQITFPSQDAQGANKDSTYVPAPFILPTPFYMTWTDMEFKNLLIDSKRKKNSDSGSDASPSNIATVLQELIHVTPWSFSSSAHHHSLLVELSTYLLCNSSVLNGLQLSQQQRNEISSRILYEVYDKQLKAFLEQLMPRGYLPSNLALTSMRLLSQIQTIWYGSAKQNLPPKLQEIFQYGGSSYRTQDIDAMETNVAALMKPLLSCATSGEISSRAIDSAATGVSTTTLLNRMLIFDAVMYQQLLERFPQITTSSPPPSEKANLANNANLSVHGRQSSYLMSVMENMVAFRLFALGLTPVGRMTMKRGARRLRSAPQLFDCIWSGVHIRHILSPVQIEAKAERQSIIDRHAMELATFSGSDDLRKQMIAAQEVERKVLYRRDDTLEMQRVKHMCKMLRLATDKTFRKPVPISNEKTPAVPIKPTTTATTTSQPSSSDTPSILVLPESSAPNPGEAISSVTSPSSAASGLNIHADENESMAELIEYFEDSMDDSLDDEEDSDDEVAQPNDEPTPIAASSAEASLDEIANALDAHLNAIIEGHSGTSLNVGRGTPASPPVSSSSLAGTPSIVTQPAKPKEAQLDEVESATTLLHFDLSTFSLFGTLLMPSMIGNRWLGLQESFVDSLALASPPQIASHAISPSSSPIVTQGSSLLNSAMSSMPSSALNSMPTSPKAQLTLERVDSKNLDAVSVPSAIAHRAPLCSLLLSSQSQRLVLFHDLLTMTKVRDRAIPDYAFDTSGRWEESMIDPSSASSAAAKEFQKHKKGASSSPSNGEKLSLFEQLLGQLSSTSPSNLRGPVGEFSWKTSFVGLSDEGAQGFVGMYKQCMASMTTQLSQAAFRPNALSESLLIPCANGLNEVGFGRNKLVLNPNLFRVKEMNRFFGFGQLLGCAIRSSTCIPLDLSGLFWKLLLSGVEGILAGDGEAAFKRGMAELKKTDLNAANMLNYIISIQNEEEFQVLGLSYTTTLTGGVTLVDLFPGGSHVTVSYADRFHYCNLVLFHRLNESGAAMQAIRLGIRSIIPSTSTSFANQVLFGGKQIDEFLPSPAGPFHLLTDDEVELLVCGAPTVDLALLRRHTIYKGCDESSPIIQHFWRVLEEMSEEDRARWLQFAWGRSRLPANFSATQQHMTINVIDLPGWWKSKFPNTAASPTSSAASPVAPTVDDAAGLRLPKSQTCFFIIDLLNFPTFEILRHKMMLALSCTDINF